MNFVFISPTFPKTYYQFTRALKRNGVNVLAISSDYYDSLNNDVKDSVNDYYQVQSLDNYDEVYRACAFFCYKYGKIDFIESNNEYWLEQDAKLRQDFNIKSSYWPNELNDLKHKSLMKKYYQDAGIKTARYQLVTTIQEVHKFIKEVGFPLCIKPDNGVGAFHTYKINNYKDLDDFFSKPLETTYIAEEFINGDIVSFDGIADFNNKIIFCTEHLYNEPIMDVVNKELDLSYYNTKTISLDLYDAGQRVVKSFNIKGRFFHFEFFRLKKDKKGLGHKGEIVALEVNMRPPGGYTPCMMNWSNDIDVYQLWADMICNKPIKIPNIDKTYYCIYSSRRFNRKYRYSIDEIIQKYHDALLLSEAMPNILASAMGDFAFIARFKNLEELKEFDADIKTKGKK